MVANWQPFMVNLGLDINLVVLSKLFIGKPTCGDDPIWTFSTGLKRPSREFVLSSNITCLKKNLCPKQKGTTGSMWMVCLYIWRVSWLWIQKSGMDMWKMWNRWCVCFFRWKFPRPAWYTWHLLQFCHNKQRCILICLAQVFFSLKSCHQKTARHLLYVNIQESSCHTPNWEDVEWCPKIGFCLKIYYLLARSQPRLQSCCLKFQFPSSTFISCWWFQPIFLGFTPRALGQMNPFMTNFHICFLVGGCLPSTHLDMWCFGMWHPIPHRARILGKRRLFDFT